MNTHLSQSILKKINQGELHPKSRWRFIVRRFLLWIPGSIAIIVGALATSALIYVVSHADWQYAHLNQESFWKFALTTLPYLWLAMMIAFVFLSYQSIRKTQGGYRYRTFSLVIGSILVSILLGSIGYVAGIGQMIDTGLGKQLRGFDSLVNQREKQWSNPEQGRMVGEVKKINGQTLRVQDIDGYLWSVDIRSANQLPESLRNTILDQHRQVRILGYLDDDFSNTFHACLILPLHPPRTGDTVRTPQLPRSNTTGIDPNCREILGVKMPAKENTK